MLRRKSLCGKRQSFLTVDITFRHTDMVHLSLRSLCIECRDKPSASLFRSSRDGTPGSWISSSVGGAMWKALGTLSRNSGLVWFLSIKSGMCVDNFLLDKVVTQLNERSS